MEAAQAELNVIAGRIAAGNPGTHRNLRPRVTPYAKPLTTGGEALLLRNILYAVNGIFLMLLAVICTNVATLVFARTATRGWEIAVRNALGASRGRIISQLFIEALVLAGGAAVLGLLVARVALGLGLNMLAGTGGVPSDQRQHLLQDRAVRGVLTLFGAMIVGVLPALRVTKANLQDSLRSHARAPSSSLAASGRR
jgi:ABC-type antimicrobial peptide transport system permease subunit